MSDLKLRIGDVSDNGQVTIVDEDRLCYQVKSESKGAVGIRTISKALLKEFVQYLEQHPDTNANQARDALSGTSEIDKFEYGYASTLAVLAKMVLEYSKNRKTTSQDKSIQSLQRIFYGAPGTGKSYAVNEITARYPDTIRTTFHPDSDYSTFVGAYKPSSTNAVCYALNGSKTVALNYPDGEHKGNPITEIKIEYKFVKQAFLEAYIKAWKIFAHQNNSVKNLQGVELSSGIVGENKTWRLTSMNGSKISYSMTSLIPKNNFEKDVKAYWDGQMYKEDPKVGTHDHYHAAVCFWCKEHHSSVNSSEECWNTIINELEEGNTIANKRSSQTYKVTLEDDNIVVRTKGNANKDPIKNLKKGEGSYQYAIAQKIRSYGLSSFDEGWNKLKDEIENSQTFVSTSFNPDNLVPQFLVIEEINRGNCAQIFGDLFQLLDRKGGFSLYPINADADIQKALLEESPEDELSFGKNGLSLSQEQIAYINQHYSNGDNVAKKIQQGQVLVLPPNLYIWATMNTSDQSLFPIDSAFKRRWAWEYVPICYEEKYEQNGKEKYNRSFNFVIEIGGNKYSWIKFLEQVNKKIYDLTDSEDKQMGNYFVDLPDNVTAIDKNTFKNKVMFYLWNDICKDERGNIKNFYRTKDGEFTFNQLFENNSQELLTGFLNTFEEIAINKGTSDGLSAEPDAVSPV